MKIPDEVKALIEKSSKAETALEAMQFSQAACNAANAYAVFDNINRERNKAN